MIHLNSQPMVASSSEHDRFLAAIDIGSSSLKLHLFQLHSNKLLCIDRLSSPVTLAAGTTSGELSSESISRAISSLRFFSLFLSSRHPPVDVTRLVATSAVRSASNRSSFVSHIKSELGFDVKIISGEEEARLIYLGILQFLPVYHRRVLVVDIGGGSTEFVLGLNGQVFYSASLNLGHVTLTERFVRVNQIEEMRNHIRKVIIESGLVDEVKKFGYEIAVGSSGTVKAIEKAIGSSLGFFDFGREWKIGRDELGVLVKRIEENFMELGFEGVRGLGFKKRRAEFIVAGAVLLMEIFEVLGVENMEVSGYALGEGVIAEMIMDEENGSDLDSNLDLRASPTHKVGDAMNGNMRWMSVVGLAVRFDCENRMKSAVQCLGIAKDIFTGIRKSETLDSKDFEYVEAAILLHNIGHVVDKKGYHKISYKIIKKGGHLHGYRYDEIKLISLLVKFHRKCFPKHDHGSLKELPMDMKKKFQVLCIIVRLSLGLHHKSFLSSSGLEIVHVAEGYKFILKGTKEQLMDSSGVSNNFTIIDEQLRFEFEHFEEVLRTKIFITIL